jgi:hypothetical protein
LGSDPAASASALDQQMALWAQYMASAFPISGSCTGGLSAGGTSDGGGAQLPNLTQPVPNQHV